MIVFNKHDASGQMAGYLYQILGALYLLLDNRDAEAQIYLLNKMSYYYGANKTKAL